MIASGELPNGSLRIFNTALHTNNEIRHANLLLLIRRVASVKVFAESIERSYSQVSQLKNRSRHSATGEPREIGDDLARHIERCLDLPMGWMDAADHNEVLHAVPGPHAVAREVSPPYPAAWPFATIPPATYWALPEATRARIEGYAQALIEAPEATRPQFAPGASG